MIIHKKSIIISGVALLALSACTTAKPALDGRLDPQLGSAVKANADAHAVAPTPRQKANTYIPANPSRAALARKNYRENTVDDPQATNQTGS